MSEPSPGHEPKKKRKYNSKRRAQREGDREQDPKFAENSRTWRLLFLEKQAQFLAFDAQFSNTFASDWLTAIENFEALESDSTAGAAVEQATADLEEATKAFFKELADVEYYFEKAFPDNERMRMEFGFDQIRTPKQRGTMRLIIHAAVLLKVAGDYTTELNAAGMTDPLWTSFGTSIENMSQKEIDQEYAKRLRLRATTKRVKQYNTLYKFWQKVNKAAAVIYMDNETVRGQWSR